MQKKESYSVGVRGGKEGCGCCLVSCSGGEEKVWEEGGKGVREGKSVGGGEGCGGRRECEVRGEGGGGVREEESGEEVLLPGLNGEKVGELDKVQV